MTAEGTGLEPLDDPKRGSVYLLRADPLLYLHEGEETTPERWDLDELSESSFLGLPRVYRFKHDPWALAGTA
ncbi:MAG: hypothetical protein KAU38_13460 [Desulfobacterales bacterium]|nr:hypothetical protein [Desulfobacterales bacterium]